MKRYVIADTEEKRDELINLGFRLMFSQNNSSGQMFVFRNDVRLFSESRLDRTKYILTDTMFF